MIIALRFRNAFDRREKAGEMDVNFIIELEKGTIDKISC